MVRAVPVADLVLLLANVLYASSYVATRVVLEDVPPATLALLRLTIGSCLLLPAAVRAGGGRALSRADRWRIAWMGVLGFAAAFGLSHWGLVRSTATNAALLITVEPVSLILLSPMLLGERLSRREGLGAGLAVAGATLVVLNGIPWVNQAVVPHWRGDLLLILAGLAYASYSLLGREVLARHPALPVTAWSILWGTAAMLPLAAAEWLDGQRPVWTVSALAGTAYLAVAITAVGYLAWNWALERVKAPRAAIFLNVQPLGGALLGVFWLGEPATVFTAAGGVLIVAGLAVTVTRAAEAARGAPAERGTAVSREAPGPPGARMGP
jgi:drug/metabolite transporter (DMT)-like permease